MLEAAVVLRSIRGAMEEADDTLELTGYEYDKSVMIL